jgi:hypothetical protein
MLQTNEIAHRGLALADDVAAMLDSVPTATPEEVAAIRNTLRDLLTQLGPILLQWLLLLLQKDPAPNQITT